MAGIAFATWLEVTENPWNLGLLVQFVARQRPDPNFMGLDAFGFFFRIVDPLRLVILMVLPVIAGWLLVSLSNHLFGGSKRSDGTK
jgi:hypothetical protein